MTEHENKNYTVKQCAKIFHGVINAERSSVFRDLANETGRKASSIKRLFVRICNNATDYSNKRIYGLMQHKRNRKGKKFFNKPLRKYIYCQLFKVDIKPSHKTLAYRIGCDEEDIEKFLHNQGWDEIEPRTNFGL